ncbi:MAG: M28 family peptidase [Chitinophagaceae bacterium]|nr:M28 family peptidase [Chitinophagaceae bacterium]MCC7378448.1 M28 family peptidase [Chitinophagaceae bacterium]
MKHFLWFLLLISTVSTAQKRKKSQIKADNIVLASLHNHIAYLADDKLEGRRTGTEGEKLAYEYITKQFELAGLKAKADNGSYIQAFEVNDGRQTGPGTSLIINNTALVPDKDFFPFSFSANAEKETSGAIALPEGDAAWFLDVKELLEENKNNPHFDLEDAIVRHANKVSGHGASALLVYNSSNIDDELKFEPKSKKEFVKIPVLYISKETKQKFFKNETVPADIKINISISDKKRTGHNVVGYIDNGAANTVILGAHYDHLGYGEDHNSLYTGSQPQIHNGADDNASGTAALIELGKLLKKSKLKKNNYLFIAFSGEELGLYGSKYYTEHPTIDFSKANYMINMDMVGRLNDSTHGLTIGGFGTSPVWGQEIDVHDKYLKINIDSSGTGPSDHTSFYRKDIPVLFFFTGAHSDYHKPSDDADKINYNGELYLIRYIYNLVEKTNNKGKLAFTKTREAQPQGRRSFSVSLGIMPDYTFSGIGVKADGVSEGKVAEKAGIKAGDVILKIGDHKTNDVQEYMKALGKFKKGDATTVTVKRGDEELHFNIVF